MASENQGQDKKKRKKSPTKKPAAKRAAKPMPKGLLGEEYFRDGKVVQPVKTKYTQAELKNLLFHVQLGLGFFDACKIAGINRNTFENWRNQSNKDNLEGKVTAWTLFFAQLDKARSEGKLRHITTVVKEGGADGAKWMLERIDPRQFHNRYVIENAVRERLDIIMQIIAKNVSEEQFDAIIDDMSRMDE